MSKNTKESENKQNNKYLVGPGLGLIIMGSVYLIWWLIFIEYAFKDPRWAHNFTYAIILLNVGLVWYQKSVLSRIIGFVQALMMPITASGSFNTVIMTLISGIILIIWIAAVGIERVRGKMFFQDRIQKKWWDWINMHSVIASWILIAHMGFVFFVGRVPQEAHLLALGDRAGWLANIPPEGNKVSPWLFDITLIIWSIMVLREQVILGYNEENKPWPKLSFYFCFVVMAAGYIGLLIDGLLH